MKTRRSVLTILALVGISLVCAAFGWWAGRTGAQRLAGLSGTAIFGTSVSSPVNIRIGRRIRLYMGSEIQNKPAFTIVAGRVYRGDRLENPMLTLEQGRVYSGGETTGPELYRLEGDRIIEAGDEGAVIFVQRNHNIHFGPEPDAPITFSFEGTRIYRGDTSRNRILATSNTVLNDPDLIKLVALVLYMETLE